MPNAYNYSNTAVQTALGGSISGAATSMIVSATTGFPGTTPYILAVDYGAATEELVKVTGVAGTTLTVERGFGGTSAQSHSLGAVVRHVVNAQDLIDFRTHEAATADVHGVTGALVGATSTQTLTNKTLTSPTINAGTLSGTFTGAHTYSGAVTMSGGGTLTGTFTGAPTLSGNVAFTGTPVFSGATTAMTVTGEIAHSNLFRGTRSVATDSQWETRQTGDSAARMFIQADGRHWWGSGTATVDTNLYRASADVLRTDDDFYINGALTVVGGPTWTEYTPTVGNAGGATYSTRSGYYYKLGKLVFLTIYISVSGAGSGSSTLTITAPSNIDRTIRQVMTANIEGSTTAAGAATLMTFLGGSGNVFDRIRLYDGGSMDGSDLQVGTLITIQGWYREE